MEKEEFEQLLGEENVVRAQYMELIGESQDLIDDFALFGVFFARYIDTLDQTIEKFGVEALQPMLADILKAIMTILQHFGGNIVQKHFKNMYNREVGLEDFNARGGIEIRAAAFIEKYKGQGIDSLIKLIGTVSDED
jgi:hypothetical protein